VHSRRCSLDAKPLHVSHLCGLRRIGLLPLLPHPQTSAATPMKPKVPVTRFISSFATQTVTAFTGTTSSTSISTCTGTTGHE
jgi:hypothetical protein